MKDFKKVFLFLSALLFTGCSTTKWEWLPPKDKTTVTPPFTKGDEMPSETIDVLKVSF
jgi:hypothetical protein|tara:strand:+ start:281 stop:454 length:174 start_codon:yes stop_codon:yes gene_type:complete